MGGPKPRKNHLLRVGDAQRTVCGLSTGRILGVPIGARIVEQLDPTDRHACQNCLARSAIMERGRQR